MRAWLLIPIVALVACMDTSKDDDDDDDEDEESGLDDFGGGVGAGSGGEGSGGEGSGGEGSGGEGSGSGGEGSGSGDEGGGSGHDYDGTYDTYAFHTLVLPPDLELPCETEATIRVSDSELEGEAECESDALPWTITWVGEVDADGDIVGEALIDVAFIGASLSAPLEGETDGSTILGVFEGEDGELLHYGQFFGGADR